MEVRAGYDRWAATYDRTSSSLVALDRRSTMGHLRPRPGERILDAGCGTGTHLRAMSAAGARPVGIDFSAGMLHVARLKNSRVPLVRADLNRRLPFARGGFDALLCALVSEHLTDLATFFSEAFSVLTRGGRLVFAAFHPELAAAGVGANFERDGVEYRLGAERHTLNDFLEHARVAGFEDIRWREYRGDSELVEEAPSAAKYVGRPLLLIVEASRGG